MFNKKELCVGIVAGSMVMPLIAFGGDTGLMLEEVVVTATKRATSVQDIPYNVSATTQDAMEAAGITDISSLAQSVPGLNVVDAGSRLRSPIVMRGMNATSVSASELYNQNTVSTYVNDTPVLDLNLRIKDIERVEVLRGPQGTLYGGGAMGGTIRYITNQPDASALSADMHTRLSSTRQAGGINSDTDFVVNVPLVEDKLALRVSGSFLDQQGFIDTITFPERSALPAVTGGDTNSEETTTGRVALRWQASDTLELTGSYSFQKQKTAGRQARTPSVGDDYTFATFYGESTERNLDLYSLDIRWDLGFAELVSNTSYYEDELARFEDGTQNLLGISEDLGLGYEDYPQFSMFDFGDLENEVFTQEIRLVSNGDSAIDWVAGAYYTSEDRFIPYNEVTPGLAAFYGADRPDDLEYASRQSADFEQWALFGEVTYHVTDQWQLTFGTRYFDMQEQVQRQTWFPLWDTFSGGPAAGLDPAFSIPAGGEQAVKDAFYKFNTSYNFEAVDAMVYFTVSEGFRRGGANSLPLGGQNDPSLVQFIAFEPDTVTNYELGLKGSYLDDRLRLNASLFHLDWQDVQLLTVVGAGFTVIANGEGAEADGVELELNYMPLEGLRIDAGLSYTDGRLSEDTLGVVEIDGQKGDRLPGSPRLQGNVAVSYLQPLNNGLELRWRVAGSYTGDVTSNLNDNQVNAFIGGPSQNRYGRTLPSYTIWNASIGLEAESWQVNLFADNLTDKQAVTSLRNWDRVSVNGSGYAEYVNRPRTLGIDLRYRF